MARLVQTPEIFVRDRHFKLLMEKNISIYSEKKVIFLYRKLISASRDSIQIWWASKCKFNKCTFYMIMFFKSILNLEGWLCVLEGWLCVSMKNTKPFYDVTQVKIYLNFF